MKVGTRLQHRTEGHWTDDDGNHKVDYAISIVEVIGTDGIWTNWKLVEVVELHQEKSGMDARCLVGPTGSFRADLLSKMKSTFTVLD